MTLAISSDVPNGRAPTPLPNPLLVCSNGQMQS
jgi:hypothetical protein